MTIEDQRKVVWILGAGFSRSLGGPLLPALLSPEAEEDVRLRFPRDGLDSRVAQIVRRVYCYGSRLLPRSDPNELLFRHIESLWDHAEDFLEYLDAAALQPEGPRAKILLRIATLIANTLASHGPSAPASIGDLAAMGRRLIAAECCAFLTDAATSSEKWRPYSLWGYSLRENDTVVTFNYDRVLEMLGASHLEIKAPEQWDADADDHAKVYKLHGSVDWCQAKDGRFSQSNDPSFAVRCKDDELAIATPGPSKLTTVTKLNWHWRDAMEAIRNASAIVFVGFRFPPSDAEARSRILGAIADNVGEDLQLHTVLGPPGTGSSSGDAPRLEGLLKFICARAGRIARTKSMDPED